MIFYITLSIFAGIFLDISLKGILATIPFFSVFAFLLLAFFTKRQIFWLAILSGFIWDSISPAVFGTYTITLLILGMMADFVKTIIFSGHILAKTAAALFFFWIFFITSILWEAVLAYFKNIEPILVRVLHKNLIISLFWQVLILTVLSVGTALFFSKKLNKKKYAVV